MRYLFLFLSFCTGCSGYQYSEHVAYAKRLSERFYHSYKTENQLVQYSSGGGMKNGVDLVCCSFEGYRKMNLKEARLLFVEGVESFCAIFNGDRTIRPFLKNFPFNHGNINLRLSFKDPNTLQVISPPYIGFVFCVNGIVFYNTYDQITGRYLDYYEEPYAEALRIVQEEREQAQQHQTQKLN